MSMTVTAIAKAALTVLTDEKARKRVGWILAAVLSPLIVLFMLICSVFTLIFYGSAGGETDGWFPGADSPYIGVDGFCSPVGENWESIVTSEFGHRTDPITGVASGHSGMDLAVPTGTPIRAALPGTVTVSKYHSSYGYYVVIEHADGLSTLYAHNSSLLVLVGQTVEAGDIISLSGSTGRSTGPHLHFEVKVNGERTNPRYYLPKARS